MFLPVFTGKNVYWVSFFSVPGSVSHTQNIMLKKAQPGHTDTYNLGQKGSMVSVECEGDSGLALRT